MLFLLVGLVAAGVSLAHLLAQIALLLIVGMVTSGGLIAGFGDWLVYNRRGRGSALLLLGLCGLAAGIALCVAFASQ